MSDEPPLSDDELAAVADALQSEHDLFTRRDIIAAATATGSLGVLGSLGIGTAEASHGTGAVQGEAGNPLDTVYTTSIDGDGDTVDIGPSVSTDELNNTTIIPTDTTDWGSAINTALGEISSGGVIVVPEGTYNHSTTANATKDVHIVGYGFPDGRTKDVPTVVDRGSTDTEFLTADEGVMVNVSGFRFKGDDTGTSDAIYTTATTYGEWVDGLNLGTGNLFHVDPGSNSDNANECRFYHVGGRQLDRVVKLGASSNSNDLQADVSIGFNVNTAVVETNGNSGRIRVGQFEGSTSPTAGVIINGQRNEVSVQRVESSEPAIQFNDAANYGEVGYNVTGDDFDFVNSNNRAVNMGTDPNFYDFLGKYRFDSPVHHDTDTSGYNRLFQSRINNSEHTNVSTQRTTGIGTTATPILSFTDQGGLAVVSGRDEGSDTTQFTDIVAYNRGAGTSVVANLGRGTPAARTYSESGGDLSLAMGSGTYTVAVINQLAVPITP